MTTEVERSRPLQFLGRKWPSLLVALLCGILWFPRWQGPIDLRWDAGVYYVLGTSLAGGHGYRIVSEPGAPMAVQYPPLLPGIVALVQCLLRSDDLFKVGSCLRYVYGVLFFCYGFLTLTLARHFLPAVLAVLATATCLAHVSTIFFSDLLFTELPFAVVVVAFCIAARAPFHRRRDREAGLFLLAMIGYLLRSAGIAFFAAWIAEAIFYRRLKLAGLRLLLSLLPIAAWQGHVWWVKESSSYRHPAYSYQRAPYQFYNVPYLENMMLRNPEMPELGRITPPGLVARAVKNAPTLFRSVGEAVSASEFYWARGMAKLLPLSTGNASRWAIVPVIALGASTCVGLISLLRRKQVIIVCFVLFSLALLSLAPWRFQFLRYLSPVTSLLTISLATALFTGWRSVLKRLDVFQGGVVRYLPYGVAMSLILSIQGYAAWQLFRTRSTARLRSDSTGRIEEGRFFHYDPVWADWENAVLWLETRSSPGEIIATQRSPHLCFLQIGRLSVAPPVNPDPFIVSQLLRSVPASFVVEDAEYRIPAVEEGKFGWRLSARFSKVNVYEVESAARLSSGKPASPW